MNEQFMIRELNFKDIPSVSALAKKVFIEFESKNYKTSGIDTFINFIKEENLLENLKNGTMKFWGCYSKEKVIGKYSEKKLAGILAVRDKNHISLLFVDKNFQRKGVATMLFNNLKETLINDQECITVNSSHYALDVYHKLGFFDTEKEQVCDGIIFTPMIYYFKKIKSEVLIRKAEIKDIDTLITLRIKQLKAEGSEEKNIKENLRNFFKNKISDGTLILYVAEDNGKIIATGGICIYYLVPYFQNETGIIANVVNMYTDIYYRRQNIASKILKKAINDGKNKGVKTFRVSASKYGKFLYLDNGFTKKDNSYELTV